MDKGSLRNLIKKACELNRKFSEPELALIAVQILNGLSYLHLVAKQAHLDIKPENILVNSEGLMKLTDFGISRDFSTSKDFMKTFIGTLQYMSPERMESQKYNYLSDMWSFGLLMMELALLKYPFLEGRKAKEYIHLYQFIKSNHGNFCV